MKSEKAAAELVAGYIRDVCPKEAAGKPRLLHLFRRLLRSVVLSYASFTREARQSHFRAVLCEVPIGIKAGVIMKTVALSLTPLKPPLEGGGVAKLRGIADRIDAYKAGDGTVWVRVVDYKTGSKKFNPEDLKLGLSLQLPIYLYSIINTKNPALLSLLGVDENRASGGADSKSEAAEKVKPAGFLYIGTAPADIQASDDNAEAGETISAPMARSGLLVMNEEILRAMDSDLKGRFIPVKLKQDGTPYAQSQRFLAEPTEFMRRFDELRGTIARISAEMRRGNAKAYPLVRGGKSPW